MTTPTIINLKPGESGSFTPTDPVYVSVRDQETRLQQTASHLLSTFSLTNYVPTGLPTHFFAGSTVDAVLDVFSDAAPVSRPEAFIDQYITEEVPYDSDGDGVDDSVYGPVLVLEKAVDGEAVERGTLYVSESVTTGTPVGCQVQFSIQAYTRGATSYMPDGDFVGVMVSFIHWPANSSVSLFFTEDGGGNRGITVSGPAQDAAGAVRTSSNHAFDWADHAPGAPFSYRVVWDDSGHTNKVYVLVTDESTSEETLLWEESIGSMGTLLASARMGSYYSEASPNSVTGVVGIDSGQMGDFIEVHGVNVETFGVPLLSSGYGTVSSLVERTTSDSTVVAGYEDTVAWDRSQVENKVTDQETYFQIEQSDTATTGNTSIGWQETHLSSESFLLLFQGSVRSSLHEGSFSTGAGLDIRDGTQVCSLRFLDDFDSEYIGVLNGSNRDTIADFESSTLGWSDCTPELLLMGSGDYAGSSFLHVYTSRDDDIDPGLMDKVAPLIEVSTGYTVSDGVYNVDDDSDPRVDIGFVDTAETLLPYSGTMTISKFILLPKCTFYYPYQAVTEPEAYVDSPWALTNSSSFGGMYTTVLTADGATRSTLLISPTTYDQYCYYSLLFSDSEYVAGETGVTVLAKLRVNTWWDQFGVSESVRIPISPVIAIDTGDDLFMQMQFVRSESGESFVYFSQDAQDYLEVLNQTELGAKISAPVDFTETHAYQVSYKPGAHIRLYLDYSDTPSIDIPWEDNDVVSRQSQNSNLLSSTASVAFGAIAEANVTDSHPGAIGLDIELVAVSLGSGFDFTCNLALEQDDLEDKVYGAQANVLVDVTDMD